jgi:hypothetical protein
MAGIVWNRNAFKASASPSPDEIQELLRTLRRDTPWPVMWVTPAGQPYLAHHHPVAEQFLLIDGELEFWDVQTGDYFPVQPGDELLIPAGRVHCVRRWKSERATYLMGLGRMVDMDEEFFIPDGPDLTHRSIELMAR